MDPKQIFKNVSEGNDFISFNGVISVIKDEDKYCDEVPGLVGLSSSSDRFNQQTFVETLNLIRRFNKEVSSVTTDKQRTEIRNVFMFKAISGGSDGPIDGHIVVERCKRAAENAKSLKEILQRIGQKAENEERIDLLKFKELANEEEEALIKCCTPTGNQEEIKGIEKSIQHFDSIKEEGRNKLGYKECVECLEAGGINEADSIYFIEIADIENQGELEREDFIRSGKLIEEYYKNMGEEIKNKEIIDEEYKKIFGRLVFKLVNKKNEEKVSKDIICQAMDKIVGKKINGRPVQSIEMKGAEKELSVEEFIGYLKDEEEEERIPMSSERESEEILKEQEEGQEKEEKEEEKYEPSRCTVCYLRCIFGCIENYCGY
ncbi:hypothetical protein EHI8A_065690 [Entamoeba histolytica HM-1:IMSS-B]|uniref:Uncharacterized protein n=5 Tax=Entamoeba histolytica TaxID=5759 RepID=B1N4B0_ENTH1|nr:hypothetical protein EHI_114440 [Entamoeba histolytica HM-1:IMSS]EMD45967.1 Hypothetical protein EHI5A_035090 [Entamoeba histolytica KU27]EMH72436.1 hypothetical protein EHI8A_065690 [Entamoeba histolytica HM-1:IMSS-B]EMS17358.1 hypothetical protein KM1_122100 [Entamoeba histolytica HM-3:IMSS]GAT97969.1 hypothetical protein CL6EHI_114440 [Entamoeba histolytica]EDS89198.1 hypothetical protein EHI_114440 [Entamoeba histolytica HM-1:IMSS]|eukprot:XP_001914026.1 hypothetical protein EHI_114440 [Entamoeba histolytica HM-1:IMSS]